MAELGVRLWRISWLMVLTGQGLLAAAWWCLSPGGFGPGHPRFWLNQVAPPLALLLVIGTLAALHRERPGRLRSLLAGWPAAWIGMALTLRFLFPITMVWLWLSPTGTAVAMGLAAIQPWRAGPTDRRWLRRLLATVVGSALAGAALAATLRPPTADTHPLNPTTALAEPSQPQQDRIQQGSIWFDAGSMIQTSDGSLMSRISPLSIAVQPLLTFLSRSHDGAPVVLVRASERTGSAPRFRDGWRTGEHAYRLSYDVPGQGSAILSATRKPGGGTIVLEAASQLDQPVYSHLNAFCDIEVRGHRRLALEFSPCPGSLIDVRHRDVEYPTGRPARFAFVMADRTFRVVEAASDEKGPFRTLAQGHLDPERALTITFHDDGRPIARLTLDDFAAQADTTLSPTAGWGVPVNAIEFTLSDTMLASPASIFITLAGTSVGRGWDCVGHRAGTYRNRIRVEPVGLPSRPQLGGGGSAVTGKPRSHEAKVSFGFKA